MENFRRNLSRRDCLYFGSLASLCACTFQRVTAETIQSTDGSNSFGSAKRCLLIWLDGGPSHLDMFDPKPEASIEVRGPLGTVKTSHAGIVFGEGLPQLAQRAGQFTIVRSLTSPVGEHNLAAQYALSGHIPGGRAAAPAFMLPVAKSIDSHGTLPTHIAVPNFSLGGGSKLQGYMAADALPWSIGSDPAAGDFADRIFPQGSQLSEAQLMRRRELLLQPTRLDQRHDQQALVAAIDLLRDATAKQVFAIDRESAGTRHRYGMKSIGQSCLLARRLLEANVPLVTINNVGWDTHDRLHERLHAGYSGAKMPVGLIPSLDQAVAALLDDLQSSGLLQETLVVVMGEFGRTPKINAQGGRDHWPRAYSVLLAGGGIKCGSIFGKTDRVGEVPEDNPVTPSDLVATMYHLLGLDPHSRVPTPDGQLMSRAAEQAQVIHSILA